ncbi:hypothetical protein [Sphingosinicella sp. CPCC 101087]|uniref:hypothetical protein n=1 Tax=Sphingosinicella sp. CPCC 101087 TaxID=2497754 RepID=UPI0013EDDE47|nr:hypothetical protein [Sphingosinicella sp. CPCC 101087]
MEPNEEFDRSATHKAEDVRGGEIILRTRRRRVIFIAGLVGFARLAVRLRLAAAI